MATHTFEPIKQLPDYFYISAEVSQAVYYQQPVVALESAVITHGLPYPKNLQCALDMENQVRINGAVPATIGVFKGKVIVGLSHNEIEQLSQDKHAKKISRRDIAPAISQKTSGGTTVSATMIAAHLAGIRVFATGGIGGVHRNHPFDISPDLPELSHTPVIVVCAGAKAILDLPATIEYLETHGVPVIGYQCNEFPAFYAARSGLPLHCRADQPKEIINIAKIHWELGLASGILVVNPPPSQHALDYSLIESVIQQALEDAEQANISGQAITPYLLQKVSELTHGESIQANLALLLNNAKLATQIASELSEPKAFRI